MMSHINSKKLLDHLWDVIVVSLEEILPQDLPNNASVMLIAPTTKLILILTWLSLRLLPKNLKPLLNRPRLTTMLRMLSKTEKLLNLVPRLLLTELIQTKSPRLPKLTLLRKPLEKRPPRKLRQQEQRPSNRRRKIWMLLKPVNSRLNR